MYLNICIFLKGLILLLKSILISVSLYVVAISAIFIDATNNTDFKADVGIVYGNKVEMSGEPSTRLSARLNAAVFLYHSKLVNKLIVSGGVGKEGFDEAKVMKHYLLNNGIPDSDIYVDSLGYNSHMTSINAFKLLGNKSSVVAISQKYHISRAKMSLINVGFEQVVGYSPDYSELRDIYAYVREVPAWFKYWLLNL